MSVMFSREFLKMFSNKEIEKKKPVNRFAFVDPDYVTGLPRLVFDGESLPTIKKYPHLSSYTPVAGDRVQVLHGVIQGKIMRGVDYD